jgi:hypothetical protein
VGFDLRGCGTWAKLRTQEKGRGVWRSLCTQRNAKNHHVVEERVQASIYALAAAIMESC